MKADLSALAQQLLPMPDAEASALGFTTFGGVEVDGPEALAAILDRWLSDPTAKAQAGQAALAARAKFQGATQRSLEILQPLLKP